MRDSLVWTVLYYLRFWSKLALRLNRPYVIGIAGSVGKSSTRNALDAILKDHFRTKVVSGNSETGVPLGILGLELDGFTKTNWFQVLIKAPYKIFNLRNFKVSPKTVARIRYSSNSKKMTYEVSIVTCIAMASAPSFVACPPMKPLV